MPEAPLRRTPLYESHVKAGGRMVPFAGYEMPVQYSSIIAEAKAVRDRVGMFDVTHMGRLRIKGEHALPFLELVTSNDVAALPLDHGQYSLLPNKSGGCVDDVIVYRLEDGYRMVINASNHEKDVDWLQSHKPGSVTMQDETESTVMIAVQGPRAASLVGRWAAQDLSKFPAFGVATVSLDGVCVSAARTGYTGEDGFELIFDSGAAEKVWNLLLEAGVQPCGLGARDTLRVEAGYPLYGHELNDDLSPLTAGLGWVISKTKNFVGKGAIEAVRQAGSPQKLMGVRLDSKRLTTPGMAVTVNGFQVGEVTSGVVSPTFDTALALAFVKTDVALGTPCAVETRGKPESGTIVGKRFYRRQ